MKRACAYLAVLLVVAAFSLTIFAHANDLPAIPLTGSSETVPVVSTEFEVTFTLSPPTTEALTISSSELPLIYRQKVKLTANVDDDEVKWDSTDKRVVKVDDKGNVTAVGRGTATIVATTEDGRSASCTVTVRYTILQWIIKIVFFGWIWY